MTKSEEYTVTSNAASSAAHAILHAAVEAIMKLGFIPTVESFYDHRAKRTGVNIEVRPSRGTYTRLEELKNRES